MLRRPLRFYCFSPPVMVATFAVEITLMLYTLIRYRLNSLSRSVVAMLFFLALFQLAEYNVCAGQASRAAAWSQTGFVAITMLPPLGIHLVQLISRRGWIFIKWIAYSSALFWVILFTVGANLFQGHVCQGNYIIFQLNSVTGYYYYVYYYAWLFIGIFMAVLFVKQAEQAVRESLLLFVFGYLIFILPTLIINTLNPSTTAGIPSIMCGFAVIFAFMLVVGIMPKTPKLKMKKI